MTKYFFRPTSLIIYFISATITLSPIALASRQDSPFITKVYSVEKDEEFDFEIAYETNIIYDSPESDTITIEKTIRKKVNQLQYFYSKENNDDLLSINYSDYIEDDKEIIKDSLEVYTQKSSYGIASEKVAIKDYEIEDLPEKSSYVIKIHLDSDISYGQEHLSIVKYETKSFLKKVGNITIIRLPIYHTENGEKPAFIETSSKDNTTTKTSFINKVSINKALEKPSKLSPPNYIISESVGYNTYSLIDNDVFEIKYPYLQFGNSQYLRFKITQVALKSNTLLPDSLSKYVSTAKNNYKIALPRESSEIETDIKYQSLLPETGNIKKSTEENNYFEVETKANKTETISLEGYAQMVLKDKDPSVIEEISITEYLEKISKDPSLKKYSKENKKYWPIKNSEIITLSDSLFQYCDTVEDYLNNVYDYVTDNVEYSEDKATDKIENTRQGAYNVLFNNAPAVCMDFSDAIVTLLRAKGFPTRTAVGYILETDNHSYDSKGKLVSHEWVEVWIPDYGWMTIDATSGDKYSRHIGGNLDRIMLYAVSDVENPEITAVTAYTSVKGFESGDYTVELEPLKEVDYLELTGDLESAEKVKKETEETSSEIEIFKDLEEKYQLQTTNNILNNDTFKRSIAISLPLIFLIILILSINGALRNFRKNKKLKKNIIIEKKIKNISRKNVTRRKKTFSKNSKKS